MCAYGQPQLLDQPILLKSCVPVIYRARPSAKQVRDAGEQARSLPALDRAPFRGPPGKALLNAPLRAEPAAATAMP